LRRAGLALIPGYLAYTWGKTYKEELLWGKSNILNSMNNFLFFLILL